ncbi:hypothetical protein [Pantoea cypripedii]|uniref:hypothetical protein n=1 Tax=Pantoea cypripedii TaxID=55209 RepID=UPI001ABF590E|nr:hypothetical protein [Pantoea cypripedii]
MKETPPCYDKGAKLLGKSADALCKKDPPKLKEMDDELREILQGGDGAKIEDELRRYMSDHRYQTISFATITDGNVSEIRTITLPQEPKTGGLILNTFIGSSKDDCEFVQKKYTDPRDIKELAELLSQPNTQVEKQVEPEQELPPAHKPKAKKNPYDLLAGSTQSAKIPANNHTSIMILTQHHND